MTIARLQFLKCEVVDEPLPRGLSIHDLDDYIFSCPVGRRKSRGITRRGLVLACVTPLIPIGVRRSEAQIAALIPVAISLVDLISHSWTLFKDIKGSIGLSNSHSDTKSGGINQAVTNDLFIESSRQITVEVPAGVNVSIKFIGPAAQTKKASNFISKSATSKNIVKISVKQ